MNDTWQKILDAVYKSNRDICVLKGDYFIGERICKELNIQPESLLFNVIANTSGIVINNWMRLLGQDRDEVNGVIHFNTRFSSYTSGLLLVACDVVGGLFAIDINRISCNHQISYFAPDTLEWEPINMCYEDFLSWCFYGDIDEFYYTMRWKKWTEDIRDIGINKGVLIYPFLWAKECNIENATKQIVPLDEIIELNLHNSDTFSNS